MPIRTRVALIYPVIFLHSSHISTVFFIPPTNARLPNKAAFAPPQACAPNRLLSDTVLTSGVVLTCAASHSDEAAPTLAPHLSHRSQNDPHRNTETQKNLVYEPGSFLFSHICRSCDQK